MTDLLRAIVRLAHERPEMRPHLLSRVAMEFPTQEALKKYLEDHPDADKSKHSVKKPKKDEGEKKDEGSKGHEKHLDDLPKSQRHIVDGMPTKSMDKEEAYNHPKIKAKVTELKKLPLKTVQKLYSDLHHKLSDLQGEYMDAMERKDEGAMEVLGPAASQVQSAWRAANDALQQMQQEKGERDEKPGVKYRYLPRAEIKKRRQVPPAVHDRLKEWEGSGNDPVHRVLDELKVHTMVPHEKLDKAVAHLKSIAKDPHHEDDKEELEKLADDLADATGRSRAAALRSAVIRLAHERADLRPHLFPVLRGAASAVAAYEQRFRSTSAQISALSRLLARHASAQGRDPTNWGFVEDLAHAEEKLAEVVEFLGGGHSKSAHVRFTDLPDAGALLDDFRRLTKVWQSEWDAEEALTTLLRRNGLREAFRKSGPHASHDQEWQQWHLETEDGEPVKEHLNVFHRPGPRPGWTSFQVSL